MVSQIINICRFSLINIVFYITSKKVIQRWKLYCPPPPFYQSIFVEMLHLRVYILVHHSRKVLRFAEITHYCNLFQAYLEFLVKFDLPTCLDRYFYKIFLNNKRPDDVSIEDSCPYLHFLWILCLGFVHLIWDFVTT